MPEKDTLKPQVMAGIFSLVQRMEEVDGLFDKVGFTLVEEGLGGLILTELHFLALIAAEGAVNGATAARKLRMTRGRFYPDAHASRRQEKPALHPDPQGVARGAHPPDVARSGRGYAVDAA